MGRRSKMSENFLIIMLPIPQETAKSVDIHKANYFIDKRFSEEILRQMIINN